ncbi:igLON family member 5-like, partial [Hypanus sabinus]|uniref:igLON family member 5-like n=1 Tax=Hypanus sabinus TaxID=79690 RepID=UPI0028C49275
MREHPGNCCDINDSVTRVAWLNGSSILYAGQDKWSTDGRVRLAGHSTRHYQIEISPVSIYDEGLYTCSFQTQDQPHTLQVYLIVQVPARIVNISSDLSLNEGESVALLCLAVGRPEPVVTWRKVGSNITISQPPYLPTDPSISQSPNINHSPVPPGCCLWLEMTQKKVAKCPAISPIVSFNNL